MPKRKLVLKPRRDDGPIALCLVQVEIALSRPGRPNRDEAVAAIDRALGAIAALRKERLSLESPVSALTLDLRTMNMLESEGIKVVRQLTGWTEAELLRLPQCGLKTMLQIRDALEGVGLRLRR